MTRLFAWLSWIVFWGMLIAFAASAQTPWTAGSLVSNSAVFSAPQHYTISGDSILTTTLTLTHAKNCKLVVLEDTAEKIVIGCRRELAK